MTDPITQQPFNPLAYVPALALALGLAAGWADLKSDATAQDIRISTLQAQVTDRIQQASGRESDQETRIRVLESTISRMSEQMTNVVAGVGRIEQRLGGNP